VEHGSGMNLSRGNQRRVRPRIKRKDTTPGESLEECVFSERSIDEDRPTKRHGIESRVSNEDIESSVSRGTKDEVKIPWILRSVTTSKEYGA